LVYVRSQATLTGWTCWVLHSKHHKYRAYLHHRFCRTTRPRDTRRVSISNDGITSRRRVFVRVSISFRRNFFVMFLFWSQVRKTHFPEAYLTAVATLWPRLHSNQGRRRSNPYSSLYRWDASLSFLYCKNPLVLCRFCPLSW